MNNLERKKIQLELMKVQTARAEMEFRIEERMEDVRRLEEQVVIQLAKEDELKAKLEG